MLRKSLRFFPFHFEGYVCSVADGDKFIKTSRVLLQKLVYKTSSCLEKIQFTNLFWWKNERDKMRHINFSSAENKLKHVMMVPSVAKWSFILLFGKPFSCSQLLSKVFIKTMNICICRHLGGNGCPSWVMWEGRKGKMLVEARERASKGRKRGEEGRGVQGWMDE